jgi:hypothetical protein
MLTSLRRLNCRWSVSPLEAMMDQVPFALYDLYLPEKNGFSPIAFTPVILYNENIDAVGD